MNIPLRRSLFLLVCSLVLVCILIGVLAPALVQAGGPQSQWVFPGGSSIKPGEETPIQMMAQVITINIRPANHADNTAIELDLTGLPEDRTWFQAVAEVEADFTMKNPTNEAVSLSAWFPLASALKTVDWQYAGKIAPSINSFQVSVEGEPVEWTIHELPNPKGADKAPLPWASFPVTFPGGSERVIHASYKMLPQPMGIELALYYIFQTGAGWAGPTGQIELILNLPYPASAETLAGVPSGSLRLPPYSMQERQAADLPPGAVLKGNQATWTWKDLEPGPEDDFAVWLLRPDLWQGLEAARAAVQANPQDGRAWLDLASTYYSTAGSNLDFNRASVFGPNFLPAGIKAYEQAAGLLPEHPAPHAGLALLSLEPYLRTLNAPPEVIQYVQGEYQIAKDLDARDPAWVKEAGISRKLLAILRHALNSYSSNLATAMPTLTAESAARQTTEAILLQTPSVTPTRKPTHTPVLSATPPLATLSRTADATGDGQSPAIFAVVSVIGLVVVGYLTLKRLRKSTEKQE